MPNLKNQLTIRITQIFDTLILSTNLSEGVVNRRLTNLAQHFYNLTSKYMTEDEALNVIKCYKNHPYYSRMLDKYNVLKQEDFDAALEV